MIHTTVRRLLPLLLYGELGTIREWALRGHLRRCPDCAGEYEQLRKLRGLLADAAPVSEDLLDAARRAALASVELRHPGREPRGTAGVRRWPMPVTTALAGAAAGLACGIFLWPVSERRALEALPPEQIRIENIRFREGTPENQEIELTMERYRPLQVRGSLEDPVVQRLLARAILSDRNAGVRLRAVNVLRDPVPQEAVDPDIRQALLAAMRTDDNAGVRMAALEAVQHLPPDRESRDALLHVLLYDVNPGLRIAAINALGDILTEMRDDDGALRDRIGELESDDNAYVRWKAKTVLLEGGTL